MKIACFASSASLLALAAAPALQAITYTYTGLDGSNDWSTGTDWSAVPISASDTILDFEGALAPSAVITSNNDVANLLPSTGLTLIIRAPAPHEDRLRSPEVTLISSPMAPRTQFWTSAMSAPAAMPPTTSSITTSSRRRT